MRGKSVLSSVVGFGSPHAPAEHLGRAAVSFADPRRVRPQSIAPHPGHDGVPSRRLQSFSRSETVTLSGALGVFEHAGIRWCVPRLTHLDCRPLLATAGKTAQVTVESDTYQITVNPGITITAPRTTSRANLLRARQPRD